MTQILACTLVNPLATLYLHAEALFAGYRAEQDFAHGTDVVISRITSSVPGGYSSVMSESRTPASFFKARATDGEGSALTIGTGSGSEIAVVLNSVCKGLADGTVSFDVPKTAGAWTRKKTNKAEPDGTSTRVDVTRKGLARLEADARSSMFGDCDAVTLYFTDATLALAVAKSMSGGMLSISFGTR